MQTKQKFMLALYKSQDRPYLTFYTLWCFVDRIELLHMAEKVSSLESKNEYLAGEYLAHARILLLFKYCPDM